MPEEIRADLLLGRDTLSPGLVKAGKAASDASGNVRQLTRDLYEVSKQRATPVVDLNDDEATAKLTDVSAKLRKLGATVADAKVGADDKEGQAKLAAFQVKLDQLGRRVSSPRLTLDGVARAQAQILALDLELDKFGAKHADATVGVRSRIAGKLFGLGGGGGGQRGLLSTIFGFGGQAAGGGAQAGGGLFSSLGQYGQGAGILAAILGGAVLTPALLPAALGLGAGGGAAGGAFLLGSAAAKQLAALNKSLASAKGPQKADIRSQIKALQKASGPELSIFGAFQDTGLALKDTFAGALKAPGQGFSGGAGAPSFLTGLTGILKQLEGFAKTLQPMLAGLFRASIPYLSMFVKFLEQATKTLLPVFTQLLQEMTPFLPQISQGLMIIVRGFAGFLNALGPSGMQASAKIFVFFAKVMAGVMVALGHTINWLAENVPKWIHDIASVFDWLRHHTATVFDGIRHDIAHYWDMIFQNSIGMVIRLVHNVETQYNSLRHGIASAFDTIRHDIASAWDTIWRNTVTRVQNGISDVIRWFKGLPGRAINAVEGLGTMLYNFGHMALTKLWNGLKSVFNDVWNWFKSLPSKLLHAIGIHSPPDWAIQAGKHIMGGILHGITSRKDELLSRMAQISSGFGGAGGARFGRLGGGVAQWAPLVSQVLRMEGLSPGLLRNVLYQMQTESGGRPLAINLNDINAQRGDPSRGLMQVIGSTFAAYHWPGTSWNIYNPLANIAAALNYARHVYGPSLMSGGMGIGSGHGYAAGSWSVPFTGPAVVHRGEMIIPAVPAAAIRSGRGGGGTVVTIVIEGRGPYGSYLANEIKRLAIAEGDGDVQAAFGSRS